MEYEYDVKVLLLDESMQHKVEKLGKEGWQFVPGAPPVAVIHMARMKPSRASEASGFGEMRVDDSKVFIVPKKH